MDRSHAWCAAMRLPATTIGYTTACDVGVCGGGGVWGWGYVGCGGWGCVCEGVWEVKCTDTKGSE